MRKDRKPEIDRLASDLGRSTSPEVIAFKELTELIYEDLKDQLVGSNGEQTVRLQGEAKAIRRLNDMLTRPAPAQQEQ